MSKEEFIELVLERTGKPNLISNSRCKAIIESAFQFGYSVSDAVIYCNCLPEFNSVMSEGTALARMAIIKSKYGLPSNNG